MRQVNAEMLRKRKKQVGPERSSKEELRPITTSEPEKLELTVNQYYRLIEEEQRKAEEEEA